jgi:tRNA-Thr(GGU) m(6)t(6)A37 methyltransferase TsaA
MVIEMQPIGYVSTTRHQVVDDYWGGEQSCITLSAEYPPDALTGLDAFSHVEVIFVFHAVAASKLSTGARHPRDNTAWPAVGIFAQRGKNRPNRIGSTICRIERLTDRRLYVRELDAIDGTPVLDLKPTMLEFLPRSQVTQPAWACELMQRYWEKAPE